MKIPKYKFKDDIVVINIGDLHRGNPNCKVDFLYHIVDKIATTPDWYWISTGDLLEVALKDSVSDVYEAQPLDRELEMLVSELWPIRKKCLGMTGSNHHKRLRRKSGLDLDKIIGSQLGIPNLGITGFIITVVGHAAYYHTLHHGVGGGQIGNKMNKAKQLATQNPGAEIYWTGHTHTAATFPSVQKTFDKKRNSRTKHTARHLITGHFLDYDESYAEDYMLEEAPVAVAKATLHAAGRGNINQKFIETDHIFS